MFKRIVLICSILFLSSSFLYAKEKLQIFHAGSLSIPFEEMEVNFEKKYPDVDVVREIGGSRACARKISDLNKPCDVMASADYAVIDQLLIPKHASWNIQFATNEMAIMYTPHSKYKDIINKDNWVEILLRDDVNYGHSDPNVDPCGYRALMVWQLAEKHYKQDGLYDSLIKGCPDKNVRPKETDLIALLESGDLDYLFIYKSVALQHGMPFVELPAEVSLKDSKYEDFYKSSSVEITGATPGSFVTEKGQSMVYGLTIPNNSPNYQMALKFMDFVLSKEGQDIMVKNGQGVIVPAKSSQEDEVPAVLKRYL
ncbi:tungstate ABC transporter substrate-binding protein WtpA [bacterium]|nr:tungstate ABC transporter substrate-binding protein WtpA [bacterium]